MRRVIDDSAYKNVANAIMEIVMNIPADEVSEYSYGSYRAESYKIKEYILKRITNIKFGKSMNTTGIGNNGCYEIIYTGNDNEEQICGLIHLTNDMFGSQIVWCSEYDNGSPTHGKRQIRGCNGKNEYDVKHCRFAQ